MVDEIFILGIRTTASGLVGRDKNGQTVEEYGPTDKGDPRVFSTISSYLFPETSQADVYLPLE